MLCSANYLHLIKKGLEKFNKALSIVTQDQKFNKEITENLLHPWQKQKKGCWIYIEKKQNGCHFEGSLYPEVFVK